MLVEHSVAESAQYLACLADSCDDFFVQGAIAGNGTSKILEMFTIGKWCVINNYVGRRGLGVWCRLVEHLRLAETDGQAEELGGAREAVQHQLQVGFCVGH